MELASKYNPADVEGKWYQYWLDNKLFSSKPDGREPYTVVIPPPNVTGVLHMGHMLNNTIQDILVRRARMMGKNACWVPGTDHASIATEAKVVNKLAQEGIKKTDLTREEFLKHAWAWTEEHDFVVAGYLKCRNRLIIELSEVLKTSRKKASKEKKAEVPQDVLHPALFESLRIWRAAKAAGLGLPAYTVLQQKALLGIANLLPDTLDALLTIPYLGKKSVEKYGDELLEIVRGYRR